MAYKFTPNALAAMAAALRTALNGGKCEIYAGAAPANAGDALNMATTHTRLVSLTVNNDGVTGLTFAVPTDGVLSKNGSEDWQGANVFSGAQQGEATLTPVFFRFGAAADNLQNAGAGPRIQGTVGGPSSAADMKLLTSVLTAGSGNITGLAGFNVRLTPLGG